MKHGSIITQAEAPKDTTFSRQSYGQYFVGCAWNNIHRLFGKRENNNWRALCNNIFRQTGRGDQVKMIAFEKEKNLFHQDNAPAHSFIQAMVKLDSFGCELLPHTPCSPDLPPSDYYLFPNLKR